MREGDILLFLEAKKEGRSFNKKEPRFWNYESLHTHIDPIAPQPHQKKVLTFEMPGHNFFESTPPAPPPPPRMHMHACTRSRVLT